MGYVDQATLERLLVAVADRLAGLDSRLDRLEHRVAGFERAVQALELWLQRAPAPETIVSLPPELQSKLRDLVARPGRQASVSGFYR